VARRSTLTVGLAAASLLASFAVSTAPAGATVSAIEGTTVGLQSSVEGTLFAGPLLENELGEIEESPRPETFTNLAGNPVVHGSNIYAVYWDPTNHYHGDWQEVINGFFRGMGLESNSLGDVFSVAAQYTDKTNVPAYNRETFRGAYTDTSSYPVPTCSDPHPLQVYKAHQTGPLTCLTDLQVQQELQSFISQHGLPKGMNTIYYLLTPPGVAVCLNAGGPTGHCSDFVSTKKEREEAKFTTASYKNSFCSYHSDVNPGGTPTGDANTLLYAVVPWTAGGLADGQLLPVDQTPATYCQDGGFNPASSPIEERESPPIQQEPNQPKCPSPDGFCDTGLADLIINQIAVEQQNTMTDPLLNAWQDASGNEATDLCRNFFAPVRGGSAGLVPGPEAGTLYNQELDGHKYYVNTAYSHASFMLNYPAVACIPGARLDPKFTAPTTVNAGDVVGFDGMESDITMNAGVGYAAVGGASQPNYATYTWNFGDGAPLVSGYAPGAPACTLPWLSPCAASVFHSYQYGGSYTVTLTVTDVAGNVASATNTVTVAGPPPPSVAPGTGTPGTASTGTQTGTGATGTHAVIAPPVAVAAVVSRSLKTVLRKGLLVRYSVNEQVAGHFDVLLSRSLARQLGISGPTATGLPASSPAQVIVAKAILVTTKGGHSTYDIKFSKRTAARLGRLHKVSLTLRLTVRNAAQGSLTTTTVLSTVNLSH
jgi:PKD domain